MKQLYALLICSILSLSLISDGDCQVGKATVNNIAVEVVKIIQPGDPASQLLKDQMITEAVVSITNNSSKDISMTEKIALVTNEGKKVYPASYEEIFPPEKTDIRKEACL